MINALYVGGDNKGLSNIAGREIKIDYVQNGMIALSAIQTGDFDAIIIEDELPLIIPYKSNDTYHWSSANRKKTWELVSGRGDGSLWVF